MIKGLLGEEDDVINVDDNILKVEESFLHMCLEDVGGRHATLWKAVVDVSTPGKDDTAKTT